MSNFFSAFLRWLPRLLSLLILTFFWLMAVGEAFLAHAKGFVFDWTGLLPFLFLVPFSVVVALAWRRAWVGTAAFGGLALILASLPFLQHYVSVAHRSPHPIPHHPGTLIAAGVLPATLIVIALLFQWSWNRRVRTAA
ncbi:MAG TPA: hypothetical protein VMU01_10665 [Rhizomicrobium sp.]|nr:hypothetical protein [Rhizomicrobium sp.]